jgi:hypothetical protein
MQVRQLIGKVEDVKASRREREQIICLNESGQLAVLYEYLIERVNTFEISIIDGQYFSEWLGESVSLNHLVCLLRRDIVEHSGVKVSAQLAGKITSWFLKGLVYACVESGTVELDARLIMERLNLSTETPLAPAAD